MHLQTYVHCKTHQGIRSGSVGLWLTLLLSQLIPSSCLVTLVLHPSSLPLASEPGHMLCPLLGISSPFPFQPPQTSFLLSSTNITSHPSGLQLNVTSSKKTSDQLGQVSSLCHITTQCTFHWKFLFTIFIDKYLFMYLFITVLLTRLCFRELGTVNLCFLLHQKWLVQTTWFLGIVRTGLRDPSVSF